MYNAHIFLPLSIYFTKNLFIRIRTKIATSSAHSGDSVVFGSFGSFGIHLPNCPHGWFKIEGRMREYSLLQLLTVRFYAEF